MQKPRQGFRKLRRDARISPVKEGFLEDGKRELRPWLMDIVSWILGERVSQSEGSVQKVLIPGGLVGQRTRKKVSVVGEVVRMIHGAQ